MNKDQLIHELESSREALLAALEDLPDEAYEEAGLMEDWTLKDVLAHLTIWEAQIVTLLFRAQSTGKPNTAHFGKESTDELNQRWYLQHKDRALEQVLDDFEGIRSQTIRRIEESAERDLNDPKRYPWLDGRPLWKWVAEETFEHEREHLESIRTWRDRRG